MSKQTGNKVALLTGASKRVGAAMSQALHAKGYNIIVHYKHSAQDAEQLVASLNVLRKGSACALQASFESWQETKTLAQEAINWQGRVDLLINNASAFYPTPLPECNEQQWGELMGSNAMAPLVLCQGLEQSLKQHKGLIINFIDAMIDKPKPEFLIYNMAKNAQLAMNNMLAKSLAPDIRVNAISPGAILWPENISEQQISKNIEGIPLGYAGSPNDIVSLVLFLLDEGKYIHGQNISVDGGRGLN